MDIFFNIVVDSTLGFLFKVFISPNPQRPGILQDPIALTFDFIIQPLICGAYYWTSIGSNKLFERIFNSDILKDTSKINDLIAETHANYKKYHILALAIGIGSVFSVAQVAAYMGWVPWKTFSGYLYIYPAMSFARLPFWFITFYGVVYGVINISFSCSLLEGIFKNPDNIKINILHPDGCGGLALIGQYATRTGYVIAPIGLYASMSALIELSHGNLENAYPIQLFILAYILLAPIVFIFPIWEAHSAMLQKKNEELIKLSNLYNKKYKEVTEDNNIDPKITLDMLLKIKTLHKETLEQYPTWPFRLYNVRQFIMTIVSSLLPILLSFAIDIIKFAFTKS